MPIPSRTAPLALALALAAGAPAAQGQESASERSAVRAAARQPERQDDDSTNLYRAAIDKVRPAIVQIKYVTSDASGMMGGGESEEQTDGVLVSADGLVLVSNFSFGGAAALFGGAPTPQDIRVFIGDDTEGARASVLARDSERDLTWIKLDKAPEKDLPHVSLDGDAEAEVGDRILQVGRASEFYGHAPKVSEGRVIGETSRPRELLFASQLLQELGMPVLNDRAEVIGFLVLQLPSQEEMQAAGGFMGGAFQPELCILPLGEVRSATENARALDEDEE